MPTQKELREREEREREEEEQAEKERNRLPDDATVDVEAEKKESSSDEILDKLDKELIGLKIGQAAHPGDRRLLVVADRAGRSRDRI